MPTFEDSVPVLTDTMARKHAAAQLQSVPGWQSAQPRQIEAVGCAQFCYMVEALLRILLNNDACITITAQHHHEELVMFI